jgi:hypothetical protein
VTVGLHEKKCIAKMNRTEDIERFKKVPRNDLLIYLYNNEFLEVKTKMQDIYQRINKPNYIFSSIIEDIIKREFVTCTNYTSLLNDRSSFFPDKLSDMTISLTPLGQDYVECRLQGYNLAKYSNNNPHDNISIITSRTRTGGNLVDLNKMSFERFNETWKNKEISAVDAYYIVTGIVHKADEEKKIFISYSWDNESHINWVKKLAEELSEHFSVEYDSGLKFGMNPFNYMKQNILSSDYVLIIFSPTYLDKINSYVSSGAKYEYSIVESDLFRKIPYSKYKPILKSGTMNESIPELMQNAIYIDFNDESLYKQNLNEIIEELKN